jgi:hypothetical protein
MACPICAAPDGATINAGLRAGALVLVVVAGAVVGAIARFAFRLWRLRHA